VPDFRIPIKANRSPDYRPPPDRFIGMDMLAEPEPFPPAFVREWERRLTPPKPSFLAEFDRILRETWNDTRRLMNRYEFFDREPWITYATPPEQQARYELRQALRKVRDV
jgi:hypothetical protein